jgi:hypothetical protein
MTVYEEYAILDAQIKALTVQKEALREVITEEVIKNGEPYKDPSLGSFSVTQTKVWTYPDWCSEAKDKLDSEIEKTKTTGEATYVEKPRLTFTAVKL